MELRIDSPDIDEYKEKRLKDEWKNTFLQAHFWIGNRSEQLGSLQPRAESQSWSVRSLRSFRDIRAPAVCRALAVLLLLAVAAVLVFPPPAQAQTPDVCRGGTPAAEEPISCTEAVDSAANIRIIATNPDIDEVDYDADPAADAAGIKADHSGMGAIDIEVMGGTIVVATNDGNFRFNGVDARHKGNGNVRIDVQNTDIRTDDLPGQGTGVYGLHEGENGENDVDIDVVDGAITTYGGNSHGVQGHHKGYGNVDVYVENADITTKFTNSHGVYGYHQGTGGDTDIEVIDTDITMTTPATRSHGVLAWHREGVVGDITVDVRGGSITPKGLNSYGIYALHQGDGNTAIDAGDGLAITTTGDNSHGIFTWHRAGVVGDITVDVRGGSITTKGLTSHGIYAVHQGDGNIAIDAGDGLAITTKGLTSYGIYALHQGDGNIAIDAGDGLAITTTGDNSHGIVAYHFGAEDSRTIDITVGGSVDAGGANAHGVRVGVVNNMGEPERVAALDAAGYRKQTVMVNGRVMGGTGEAAGVFLAGGGRVVIGPRGSVGARSRIAILATGDTPGANPGDSAIKPKLRVDLNLDHRRAAVAQAIGDSWIINDGGETTIVVNGVVLHDGEMGVMDRTAPNGAWNLRMREKGVTVTDRTTDPVNWVITEPATGVVADRDFSAGDFIEVYAARAAVYEALPSFLLRLDAPGLSEERVVSPGSPVWVKLSGGSGSYEPERASVGAEYDSSRFSVEAGINRSLSERVKGSVSVRSVRGSTDVISSVGGGEIEAEGLGFSLSVSLDMADDFYVRGGFSLTNYEVDLSSDALDVLRNDVEARASTLNLEAGKRMAIRGNVNLTSRVWMARSAVGWQWH